MNNKQIGTAFEKEMCEILTQLGYWVHFIAPDARGAQPFDIIAVKDGRATAMDCKTCVAKSFSIGRLECNQVFAFELWLKRNNGTPYIMAKHDDKIYQIPYTHLRQETSIRLDEKYEWKGDVL